MGDEGRVIIEFCKSACERFIKSLSLGVNKE
jgi:hypothetical protein